MEGIHGVDVSWLHHTKKGKHNAYERCPRARVKAGIVCLPVEISELLLEYLAEYFAH